MILALRRTEKSRDGKATIGDLFVDGVHECFVLEDTVREVSGRPVASWKVSGQTAIPAGTYRIVIDRSPLFSLRVSKKFKASLDIYTPHLLDVSGYSGIRIHPGVRAEDTEGCLCPGRTHTPGEALVGESRLAMTALLPKLERALGIERVSPPDPRMAEFLRHWAWGYKEIRKPEEVWITITNEFPDDAFFAPSTTSQE